MTNDDDGQLTDEEAALIDRLRQSGTPPGEVQVSGASEQRRIAETERSPEQGSAERALTRDDIKQVVREETARNTEQQRTEESRRQMTAHINAELDKHGATKDVGGRRRTLMHGLVWDEFIKEHPDPAKMSAEQIDQGLTQAVEAVAKEEAELRGHKTETAEGKEARTRLENQQRAAEGAGAGARSAGRGSAIDPNKPTGKLSNPSFGVDASSEWLTSDDQLNTAVEQEAERVREAMERGDIPVPPLPVT